MDENDRLFPIGILAKLSGVHVRSLRYYEKLGILLPTFVDPETGYRYYTYRQMRVVEAIQYCVELDIPLKKFRDFFSHETDRIDYAALVEYGKRVTEEKMASILRRQRVLEVMTQGMSHAERCVREERTEAYFPERHFYCLPYEGPQAGGDFQSAMVKLIRDLEVNGFRASYDNGVLIRVQNGAERSYCFLELYETRKDLADHPRILRIPAGRYLSVIREESSIHRAGEIFPEYYSGRGDLFIMETELFTRTFHYTQPAYELRCLISTEQ